MFAVLYFCEFVPKRKPKALCCLHCSFNVFFVLRRNRRISFREHAEVFEYNSEEECTAPTLSRSRTLSEKSWPIGMRVEVKLRGKWKEGVISYMNKDETIDISCETENRKIKTNLKLYDNEVRYLLGDNNKYQVQVKREQGHWTRARICRMHTDGTCDVKIENSRQRQRNVVFGTNMRYERKPELYRIGTFVEIRLPESPDQWTRVLVYKVERDDLKVAIGPKEDITVSKKDARLPVGTKVEGYMGQGRWKLATVEKVHIDRQGLQKFDLLFDDGLRVQNIDASSQVRLANTTDANPWETTTTVERRTASDGDGQKNMVLLREGLALTVQRPDSSLSWQGVLQSRCVSDQEDDCTSNDVYVVRPLTKQRDTKICKRSWLKPLYCANDMVCPNRSGCMFYHSERIRRLLRCGRCQRHAVAFTDRDITDPPFFGLRRLGCFPQSCPLTVMLADVCDDDEQRRLWIAPCRRAHPHMPLTSTVDFVTTYSHQLKNEILHAKLAFSSSRRAHSLHVVTGVLIPSMP